MNSEELDELEKSYLARDRRPQGPADMPAPSDADRLKQSYLAAEPFGKGPVAYKADDLVQEPLTVPGLDLTNDVAKTPRPLKTNIPVREPAPGVFGAPGTSGVASLPGIKDARVAQFMAEKYPDLVRQAPSLNKDVAAAQQNADLWRGFGRTGEIMAAAFERRLPGQALHGLDTRLSDKRDADNQSRIDGLRRQQQALQKQDESAQNALDSNRQYAMKSKQMEMDVGNYNKKLTDEEQDDQAVKQLLNNPNVNSRTAKTYLQYQEMKQRAAEARAQRENALEVARLKGGEKATKDVEGRTIEGKQGIYPFTHGTPSAKSAEKASTVVQGIDSLNDILEEAATAQKQHPILTNLGARLPIIGDVGSPQYLEQKGRAGEAFDQLGKLSGRTRPIPVSEKEQGLNQLFNPGLGSALNPAAAEAQLQRTRNTVKNAEKNALRPLGYGPPVPTGEGEPAARPEPSGGETGDLKIVGTYKGKPVYERNGKKFVRE